MSADLLTTITGGLSWSGVEVEEIRVVAKLADGRTQRLSLQLQAKTTNESAEVASIRPRP